MSSVFTRVPSTSNIQARMGGKVEVIMPETEDVYCMPEIVMDVHAQRLACETSEMTSLPRTAFVGEMQSMMICFQMRHILLR